MRPGTYFVVDIVRVTENIAEFGEGRESECRVTQRTPCRGY
jgi:hypothetical protein